MVKFAINNAVHASTGLTPFFVNFGRQPSVPAFLGLGCPRLPHAASDDDADESGPADGATSGYPVMRDRSNEHFVNPVDTRTSARASREGVRTRSATRASSVASRGIAEWTSRTLINPSQVQCLFMNLITLEIPAKIGERHNTCCFSVLFFEITFRVLMA
ncbi:hypothetical protein JG688_00016931 [Phytophthora aleatoria]|uniref:Reverse transcriptase n=1 Tax=Phytophthora aleatoria TaxID=2496075 RepID=A0A8J5MCJ0_9STRA|nr:hypothetical protein JG688_00016931 [Phytophthora aleatoria]